MIRENAPPGPSGLKIKKNTTGGGPHSHCYMLPYLDMVFRINLRVTNLVSFSHTRCNHLEVLGL